MDIRVVIKKGLVYATLITAMTAFIALGLITAHQFLGEHLGLTSRSSYILLGLLLSIIFVPLYHLLQSFLFKFIFRRPFVAVLDNLDKIYTQLSDTERYRLSATLASSLAHEIRNPLTALYTFTDQAEKNKHDPLFWEKFGRITKNEIARINALIQELMDFASPKHLKMEKNDLNVLIRDCLTLTEAQLREKAVNIKLELCRTADAILDKQKIQQVILNLVLNAIEAMPHGGTLTIETREANRSLQVTISDTGCGMTPEQYEKIFEPFYTTKDTGHGLGMAVVKQILDSHGWNCRIESNLDRGTSFILQTPGPIQHAYR